MNSGKPKKFYSFSVIIPAFNEEDSIADCLKSLKKQDYPGKIEIIVVDNASTDKTAEIARENGAIVLYEGRKGISAARRKGYEKSTGEILAYTDADSKVPPDWIARLNHIFNSDEHIAAVGGFFMFDGVGFIINLLANKIFLPINNLAVKYILSPYSPFLTGSNMALRRDVYEKSGGFDPKIMHAEDIDMAKKAAKFGKVYFDSKLKVKTSFRRYSGGHKNILFVLSKAIRESFVVISKFVIIKFSSKALSVQPDIREKDGGKTRENYYAGGFVVTLIILTVLSYGVFAPQTNIFGSTFHRGNLKDKNKKIVAITFDDGPYGDATNQILDILNAKNAKATFFLIGKNAQQYPNIVQREIAEGHTIGNHSFDHPWLLFLKGSKSVDNDTAKAEQAIYAASGLRSKYFRPPHGFKSPMMINSLKKKGYDIILWNDITTDYNASTSPEKITQNILRRIKPGSIITLHDGRDTKINYPRENVIEALPAIIDGIRAKGFEIVPLDQLIGEKAYF